MIRNTVVEERFNSAHCFAASIAALLHEIAEVCKIKKRKCLGVSGEFLRCEKNG